MVVPFVVMADVVLERFGELVQFRSRSSVSLDTWGLASQDRGARGSHNVNRDSFSLLLGSATSVVGGGWLTRDNGCTVGARSGGSGRCKMGSAK